MGSRKQGKGGRQETEGWSVKDEREHRESGDKQIPLPRCEIGMMGTGARTGGVWYFAKGHGFIRAIRGRKARRL